MRAALPPTGGDRDSSRKSRTPLLQHSYEPSGLDISRHVIVVDIGEPLWSPGFTKSGRPPLAPDTLRVVKSPIGMLLHCWRKHDAEEDCDCGRFGTGTLRRGGGPDTTQG